MERLRNKGWIIIVYGLICLSILYIGEQIFLLPYSVKTGLKIPMFILFPFLINRYWLKEKTQFHIRKGDKRYLFIWSLLVMVIIFLAYFLLEPYLDIEAIREDFSGRMQISRKMMYGAAVYTIIVNSFIEEYFFRGFIFKGLGTSPVAYLVSSLLFAIYHVAIFGTWFNLPLILLMLLGLFIGGLIFAYFTKKADSFLGSWVIHLSADLAIVGIGLTILL